MKSVKTVPTQKDTATNTFKPSFFFQSVTYLRSELRDIETTSFIIHVFYIFRHLPYAFPQESFEHRPCDFCINPPNFHLEIP